MERRGIPYSARERELYRQSRVNVENKYLLIARCMIQHGENDGGIEARVLEKYCAAIALNASRNKNRGHKQGLHEFFLKKSSMFW